MATEYVAKHKLSGTIEKALAEALAPQPENPYEALAAWFESKAGAPASSEDKDFGTGEKKAGEANGYGVVAVDLAAEAKKLRDAKPKPGDPNYIHLPGMDQPPPTAMKKNPITGEMEEFHSEKLKDDLPAEEAETAEIEIPVGDDY